MEKEMWSHLEDTQMPPNTQIQQQTKNVKKSQKLYQKNQIVKCYEKNQPCFVDSLEQKLLGFKTLSRLLR